MRFLADWGEAIENGVKSNRSSDCAQSKTS